MAEVEFRLTGDLGRMPFPAVLSAMKAAFDALIAVQDDVLGQLSSAVQWTLSDLRAGSAATLLRAEPVEEVPEADLARVVEVYGNGTEALAEGTDTAPAHFSDKALVAYRDMTRILRSADLGDLVVSVGGRATTVIATAPEGSVLRALDEEYTVEGSVVGSIEAINVHGGGRKATLYSDLDRARVLVTFGEALYQRVHGAMRRRVEVTGTLVEDARGTPKRMTLREIVIMPDPGDVPTLASLVGSVPDLTEGLPAEQWLENRRAGMGLG